VDDPALRGVSGQRAALEGVDAGPVEAANGAIK
jgi:hypothetical protein